MSEVEIKGYQVRREIGQGGMATVYLALQNSMEREVALKVVKPALVAAHDGFGKRFLAESRTVGKLNHPNIVMAHDFGESSGDYYLVTEYIVGGDLKRKIKQGITPEEAVKVMKEIGAALSHAHGKNFVHRDIKPENILFRDDGTAVLTDFGIAKAVGSATRMTKTGLAIGTPHYMSPEQARGGEVDLRSDLYSLGILFYEMLTGSVPYKAEDIVAIAVSHMTAPLPEFPPKLKKYQPILDNLLAKEPKDRYSDADTMLSAINDVEAGQELTRPFHATNVSPTVVAPAPASFSGTKWAMGGCVLALLLGVIAYLYLQQNNSPQVDGVPSKISTIDERIRPSAEKTTPALSSPQTIITETKSEPPKPSTPATAILSVISHPEGAEVYLGNRKLGVTPLTIANLPAGQQNLTVRKEYYVEKQAEVNLSPDHILKRNYVLERGKGSLSIVSSPAGSEIWLDKKKIVETTPATLNNLEAGKHNLLIHKDRYYDSEHEVVVIQADTQVLDVNLFGGDLVQFNGKWMSPVEADEQRKASMGRITVIPTPADSKVKILNITSNYTPGLYLQPGRYHVEVSKPSHLTIRQWIDLSAGEHYEFSPELKKGYRDPLTGMEFVWVEGGCYQMGDTFDDGYANEKPVREVCVSGFYMGKYEVTQNQYQKINGSNHSGFRKGNNYPMEMVSWEDVQKFIRELNINSRKKFRLPTEAEWEYAARSGGKKEKYAGSNDVNTVAWYLENSGRSSHPVGRKSPNSLGLYDMSGNVWEWCSDFYDSDYYKSGPRDNPQGVPSGSYRVYRGGSWSVGPSGVRAAIRFRLRETSRVDYVGFRLASSEQ